MVVQPCAKDPIAPYEVVVQMQPISASYEQSMSQLEVEVPFVQRKSGRLVNVKQEPTPQAKKRVMKTTKKTGKRRKTMQVSSSKILEDDTKYKLIEQDV